MSAAVTQIAAHRGGAALWPENSEAAFRGAIGLGVEQVEFDVQRTADGVPVIFHDTTLDRMTDGTGPLADRTLAELQGLTLKGGGRILTLEEGLDILGPSYVALRCEVKPGPGMVPYPGLLGLTLDSLRGRGLLPRAILTSFHLPTLREAKGTGLRETLWLVSDQVGGLLAPSDIAQLAQSAGTASVALHHRALRFGDRLQRLRDEALTVSAFGVLEDDAISWALAARLPVFTTDRPDAALRLREALEV